MNCLASPVFGRPTRTARFSSAAVDSGMSEKSIRLSGICLALFAARLPRSLIVRPHAEYLDDSLLLNDLVQEPMLYIDATRVRASQIAHELLKRRRF